jgi:hypothetical protein
VWEHCTECKIVETSSTSERPDVWDRSDDGFCAWLKIRICEQANGGTGALFKSGSGRSVDEVDGIGAPDYTWYVCVGEGVSNIHAFLEFTEFQWVSGASGV